jgi:hypothetical protein
MRPSQARHRQPSLCSSAHALFAAALLMFPSMVHSGSDGYFPLTVGNRWTYEFRQWVVVFETADGRVMYQNFDEEMLLLETKEPVPVSEPFAAGIVSIRREQLVERVQLSVEATEQHSGQTYYRMSTGQLLRTGVDMVIYRYDETSATEGVVLDVPQVLQAAADERQFDHEQVLPFVWRGFYRPFAYEIERPAPLAPDTAVSTLVFGDSDGHTACHTALAYGIGPTSSGCGNDVPDEGFTYELIEASLGGLDLPSLVPASSWGRLKETTGTTER